MQITKSDLGSLIDRKARYQQTIQQSLWPFWEANYDSEYGAFLPTMNLQGVRQDTTKPGWSAQRSSAALSLLLLHYSRPEYRDDAMVAKLTPMAEQTLDFVADNSILSDEDGILSCCNGLTQSGGVLINPDDDKPFPKSLFVNLFAVYAIALYAQTGINHHSDYALSVADRLLNDTIQQSEVYDKSNLWYPTKVPEGYRLHPSEMMFLLACHHMAKAERDSGVWINKARKYSANIMEKYLRKLGAGFVLLEYLTNDYQNAFSHEEGTIVDPGHAIESIGFVLRLNAYLRSIGMPGADQKNLEYAANAMLDLFKLGWEETPSFSSLVLHKDALSRETHSDDEGKRPWWSICESATQSLYAYSLVGNPKLLGMHGLAHDAYFNFYFNPEIGEATQRLDEDGKPDERIVAFPTLDMMHTIRAFIEMIETIDYIQANFEVIK